VYFLNLTESELEKMIYLQRIYIIAVFLLSQQSFVESAVEECSGEAEYSISGMMLRRHIFKKITGASLGDACLRECYRDVRCQSFNHVISRGTCELSNRTKEARPKDFVPDSDRYYFKRDKNRGKFMRPKHYIRELILLIHWFSIAHKCNYNDVSNIRSRRRVLLGNCPHKRRLLSILHYICWYRLMLVVTTLPKTILSFHNTNLNFHTKF